MSLSRPATAQYFAADLLPQELLDACDAHARPFGDYDKHIANAADALIDLGVFSESEFGNVDIGYCGLRAARGPAATISCARDIILLDRGYGSKERGLALTITLAHEMKHYLQHQEKKAAFGEAYCQSEGYAADKIWMERDADAFGDEVAALMVSGRPVELVNECPVAVTYYLEADRPAGAGERRQRFEKAPPKTTVASAQRALSREFKFYGASAPMEGAQRVWQGKTMAHRRFIDGESYGLARKTLANAERTQGPFQLRLSCAPESDG